VHHDRSVLPIGHLEERRGSLRNVASDGEIEMRQFTLKLLVRVLSSVFAAVVSAYVAPMTNEIDWIDAVALLTCRGAQTLFEGLGSMPRG